MVPEGGDRMVTGLLCPTCQKVFPEGIPRCPEDGSVLVPRPRLTPSPGEKIDSLEALLPTLRQEELAAKAIVGDSKERAQARASAPQRPDPLVGQIVAGRYAITRKIGEGGMGAVYEAQHTLIGKRVAIKVLLDKYAQKESIIARLNQEARLASAIGHPHIVDITDLGKTEDGRTFVVMEYLEGESLAELIAREGPLAPERALRIAVQVADALAAAHAKGIIHRDVKPENIFLVGRDGREFVKVVDFGISKHLRPDEETEEVRLTQTGMVLGTPLYMSPEQARGEANLDHRIDIYALGVILYEMVTNEVPFRGANYLGILSQVLTKEPTPPRELRPDLAISEACERVILKAMAKNREDRYQTMAELAGDLHRLLSGDQNVAAVTQGTALPHPSSLGPAPPGRVALTVGRSSLGMHTTLALLFGVAALGAAVVFVLLGERDPQPEASPDSLSVVPLQASPPAPARDASDLAREGGPTSQPASLRAGSPASEPTVVRLRIETRPKGATVYVDGEKRGTAPVEVTLPRLHKPVRLRAVAPGFEEATLLHMPEKDAAVILALREKRTVRPSGSSTPELGPGGVPTAGPIDETAPSPYALPPTPSKKPRR